MKLPEPTKKLLVIIISILLLHSLFPPRLYVKDNTSAGRNLVIWPRFHKADYDSLANGTIGSITFGETTESDEDKVASWNRATLDLGTYLAELVAILCIGAILILRQKQQ